MPVIPRRILNSVFYLYRSREDAISGTNAGGTGFFAAIPSGDGLGHHYGITNWHVAVRDGFSVIRLNTVNSGVSILEFDPSDWTFEPGKDDIAVIPLSLREPDQVAQFIGTQVFLTRESAVQHVIGPGDDVFMVGRFVDLDEREVNTPSMRFGNISTVPVKVPQATGYKEGVSYCVDMHSRSGYSGSPVFAYRTPGGSLEWIEGDRFAKIGGALLVLLGIHWGQFPETWDIVEGQPQDESHAELVPGGKVIRGLSGMTCVLPAWNVVDLLSRADLQALRDKELAARRPGGG